MGFKASLQYSYFSENKKKCNLTKILLSSDNKHLPFRGGLDVVSLPEATGQLAGGRRKQQQVDAQQNAHRAEEVGQYLHITCGQ